MNAARNKVIIVEPSPVVCEGLRRLLEENGAFRIVGAYAGIEDFRSAHRIANFDLLLLNPAAISKYRKFSIRSMLPDYADAAFAAIVYGYVNAEILEGFDGIVDIYNEPPQIVRRLRNMLQTFDGRENPSASIDLSQREKEILLAVAKGLSNKEIADQHCISVHTVVAHRKNITRKTGIRTVAGLTLYAVFNNMISHQDVE